MNSFGALSTLESGGKTYAFYRLDALGQDLGRLPFSLRVLLENLLRQEDGENVTADHVHAILNWDPNAEPSQEIAFTPARTLLQDFTGVPCVVDLAAMRDAMAELGGDPAKINPLQPVELVIDHSVQVDAYGNEAALMINRDLEFDRNQERYAFLKWGQSAFDGFKVVPPNTGIVHQVNLEYLARVVMTAERDGQTLAYPDTLVGTDSHTTMINGLGVLGWGVGGIEAEAAMLGQPISMLVPEVVGFRFTGKLREGATSTDLVLTVTEILRRRGVVGKFVEFFGPGLATLPLADRATIGNMAPEYGATCGFFPVDEETLSYLRLTNRSPEQVALVRDYLVAQGLFHTATSPEPDYSFVLELDLGDVEPSVAGPKRPQDRSPLSQARSTFFSEFGSALSQRENGVVATEPKLQDGSVVIAAITSCTNTSNPSVMVAAGILARKARSVGLLPKPWVKTSLAPGSRVVTDYLTRSGLQEDLDAIGFHTVGYGCTTCIGNSGPLPEDVSREIQANDLVVVSVLSGNRNFEGRINPEVKANYLMSPPLVVAYALAGTIDIDLTEDPLGHDQLGHPVYLRDIWPSQSEVAAIVGENVQAEMFARNYAEVFQGDEKWNEIEVTGGDRYAWQHDSTYIQRPPYFDGMRREPSETVADPTGLRALALLGDSVTTDHISPAGAIKLKSPAGEYLTERGVRPHLFNSYGSRRGNHEVMVRGTFANVRLRNQLAPGTEGGYTTYFPTGEVMDIYEASRRYAASGTPLMVLAGKEYGSGSSRDWAAKGPMLLGVKVVLAESFERIHRSNLVGMGILPLQFEAGSGVDTLGLTGQETFDIEGFADLMMRGMEATRQVTVRATAPDGRINVFPAIVRIDTPRERDYFRHGGILPYVLRQLLD